MNKYCPTCKMNFSESFEECPYCEGELIIQELSKSPEIADVPCAEDDLLNMTDEELLVKYKSYLESIRSQGCNMTDQQFVNGLRISRREKLYGSYRTDTQSQQVTSATSDNQPKCPTCGSINVQRIGTGEKIVSGALWGLFSNKVHKSYKCNNCKYMW